MYRTQSIQEPRDVNDATVSTKDEYNHMSEYLHEHPIDILRLMGHRTKLATKKQRSGAVVFPTVTTTRTPGGLIDVSHRHCLFCQYTTK